MSAHILAKNGLLETVRWRTLTVFYLRKGPFCLDCFEEKSKVYTGLGIHHLLPKYAGIEEQYQV